MGKDLKASAQSWLKKQGFPLEMRVARVMSVAQLSVELSTSVLDLQTGKECEIDVVASATERLYTGFAEFSLLSECKHSDDKPWIGFIAEEPNYHRPSNSIYNRIATRIGGVLLLELSVGKTFVNNPVFALPKRVCYGIVRAFQEKNEDMVYGAISKAERSCLSRATYSDEMAKRFNMQPPVEVYFPLVITDAPLFECILNDDGVPELTETHRLTLVRNRSIETGYHQIVQVLHEDALPGFLAEFASGWAEIAQRIRDGVPTTLKVLENHDARAKNPVAEQPHGEAPSKSAPSAASEAFHA